MRLGTCGSRRRDLALLPRRWWGWGAADGVPPLGGWGRHAAVTDPPAPYLTSGGGGGAGGASWTLAVASEVPGTMTAETPGGEPARRHHV